MKYPIGVQSFVSIRDDGYVYVDKTELIYALTQNYKYVSLFRPRAFGRSLLLSTIRTYFEGKRELFKGLAIDVLEKDWEKRPVIHIDMACGNYSSEKGLRNHLCDQLSDYERIYGKCPNCDEPNFRFRWLLRQAYEITGRRVVVLVDDYDKPLIQSICNKELNSALRTLLKSFYSIFKSEDGSIHFAMIAGMAEHGDFSEFSDANNLEDISFNHKFATICGITQEELIEVFSEPLEAFAKKKGVSKNEIVNILRKKYGGYRFSPRDTKVFNPNSLMQAIQDKYMGDYWYEGGTPSSLKIMLEQKDCDISNLERTMIGGNNLYHTRYDSVIPLLYQSGYLTIKEFDKNDYICTLGIPNKEVERSFRNHLIPLSKANSHYSIYG